MKKTGGRRIKTTSERMGLAGTERVDSLPENIYKQVFEEACDAIIVFECGSGRVAAVNREACRMLKYSPEQAGNLSWESMVAPEEMQSGRQDLRRLMDGAASATLRLRLGLDDERCLTVEAKTSRIRHDGSAWVVGIFRDVTALDIREKKNRAYSQSLKTLVASRTAELEKTRESLIRRERLSVLGQLAGGVGHELRNPLGAIKTVAYFLRTAIQDPDPDIQEALDILENEVALSTNIITTLNDYARQTPPRKEPVLLLPAFEAVRQRIHLPGSVSMNTCDIDAETELQADPDQLDRILDNLVTNAVRAMPHGGEIRVKAFDNGDGRVRISVADSGTGVQPRDLERIFEPLFSTRPRGMGLGLSLVRMLVEGHGGSIRVESTPGEGSTFTVIFPAAGGAAHSD